MESRKQNQPKKKYKSKTQRLSEDLQESRNEIDILEKRLKEYVNLGQEIYKKSSDYIEANEIISFLKAVNKSNKIAIELTEEKYLKLFVQFDKMQADMNQFCANHKNLDYFIGCCNSRPISNQIKELERSNIDLQAKINMLEAQLKARDEYVSDLQDRFVTTRKELDDLRRWQKPISIEESQNMSKNPTSALSDIQKQAEGIIKTIDSGKGNHRGAGRPNLYTDEKIQLIYELKNRGCSIRSISKTVGCSVGTVHRILKNQK